MKTFKVGSPVGVKEGVSARTKIREGVITRNDSRYTYPIRVQFPDCDTTELFRENDLILLEDEMDKAEKDLWGISIDDGFCEWRFPIEISEKECIDGVYKKITKLFGSPELGGTWRAKRMEHIDLEDTLEDEMETYKGYKLKRDITLEAVWKNEPCEGDWDAFFKHITSLAYGWSDAIKPEHCLGLHDSWDYWFVKVGFTEKVEDEKLKMEIGNRGVTFRKGEYIAVDASLILEGGTMRVHLSDFDYTASPSGEYLLFTRK